MLLAFDVGNTNIVLGVFKEGKLIENWRLETDPRKSADEYGMLINQLFDHSNLDVKNVKDIIIATVVPSVLYTLQHLATKYFNRKAIVIESGVKTGLIIRYDNPKQVGSDRIVNAVAAYVTDKAEYLGGAIAPGLKISSEALFSKTSKLPKVELDVPKTVICKNTIQSMQSGLVYGHMGMVDFIIRKMKVELEKMGEPPEEIKVIATGGLATLISEGVDQIDIVDKMLTLEGLRIIYDKNKDRKHK